MKRTILVLSLFAASMASAQVAEELVPAKTNNFQDEFVNHLNTAPQNALIEGSEIATITYGTVNVGKSFYDLQTNTFVISFLRRNKDVKRFTLNVGHFE